MQSDQHQQSGNACQVAEFFAKHESRHQGQDQDDRKSNDNRRPERDHAMGGRTRLIFDDPRLKDLVADNLALDDFTTEGEEILFGSNFGIVTHIETGSDGALYLVSPAGNIRKISKN